jgi:hypothetical protein
MRCLLLSCSDRKLTKSEALPALERYDGPMFRIVRRYLRTHPDVLGRELLIGIISAHYGLLLADSLIPFYDLRMTRSRAISLQPTIVDALRKWLPSSCPLEIFIALGKEYLPAVEPIESWLPSDQVHVTVATGGSGRKQQQLVAWLRGESPTAKSRQLELGNVPPGPKGEAVLRGVKITATASEIEERVGQWIAEGDVAYLNVKEWVAQVGPYTVAPKWLVSRLSGVPVSRFAADEARRVLSQLGIPLVHR